MQVVNLEDVEGMGAKMDAMEATITGKIGTIGDQIAELKNVIENQMIIIKELRDELKEVRHELLQVRSTVPEKTVQESEEREEMECEVVPSAIPQATQRKVVNKDTLEESQAQTVSDQLRKRVKIARLRADALKKKKNNNNNNNKKKKKKTTRVAKTMIVNNEKSRKRSADELNQEKLSSPPTVPPTSSDSLLENTVKEQVHRLVHSLLSIEPVNSAVGQVPLISAVLFGGIHEVCKLLECGANICMRDAWGLNALHYAAVCGLTDIAKVLLRYSKELVATRASSKDYSTPLHLAAEKGHTPVSDVLIAAGANVTSKNTKGLTALHIAAMKGHTDLVGLLLSKGADAMSTDKEGQCALHLAAKGGHIDVVNVLLDKNSDVRKVNSVKQTALHLAATEGHLSVVDVLFHRGSEIRNVDRRNYSPLHYAAENGHTDIVKFLLSKNADVTLLSTANETALCCAAKNGHHEIVKALIAKGITLTTSGQNALKALDLAASKGHSWVVYSLLKVTQNISGKPGDQAVCASIDNNLVHALKALIMEGANPNAKGSDGCHAIERANRKRYAECTMILESAGGVRPIQNTGIYSTSQYGYC